MNRRLAQAQWTVGVPLLALAIGGFFGYFLRGHRMAPASRQTSQETMNPFTGTWILAGVDDPEEPGRTLLLRAEGKLVLGNTATMRAGARLEFDVRRGQVMTGLLTDSDGSQTPASIETTPDGQKLVLTFEPPGGGIEYLLYLRARAPEENTN